jgi:hypothetical protein
MKKILLSVLLAAAPIGMSAQVISDFNVLSGDNYSTSLATLTFNAGTATIGSPSTADQSLDFANIEAGTLALTSGLTLEYIASSNTGNASASFKIRFADDQGTYIYDAEVITSSWVANQFVTGTFTVPDNFGTASYFTIAGDGTANPFRMSFDTLRVAAAVPEPSSFAALAGFAVLGLAASRRRRA